MSVRRTGKKTLRAIWNDSAGPRGGDGATVGAMLTQFGVGSIASTIDAPGPVPTTRVAANVPPEKSASDVHVLDGATAGFAANTKRPEATNTAIANGTENRLLMA